MVTVYLSISYHASCTKLDNSLESQDECVYQNVHQTHEMITSSGIFNHHSVQSLTYHLENNNHA